MVLLKALGISNRLSIDFDRLCASMKGIDFGIDSLGQLAVDVSSYVLNHYVFMKRTHKWSFSSAMLTRLFSLSILTRMAATSALLNFHTRRLLVFCAPLPTSILDRSCSNACLYSSRGPFS